MKKVLIFTNADWHFYNHLLPIALEFRKQKYDVILVTDIKEHQQKIESHGIRIIPIKIQRSDLNSVTNLILMYKFYQILKQEKPDILMNFTIKPIVFGSIVGALSKVPKISSIFLGMGHLFISNNIFYRILRFFICKILYLSGKFSHIKFIVQNSDDRQLLINMRVAKPKLIITQCCVGLDMSNYQILPEPKGQKIVFALVGRMLKTKGVVEFIKAAKILHKKGVNAEFWLVGSPDPGNKASIDLEEIKKYCKDGSVKYLGHVDDIKSIWERAHVAVLPSYREGLSRALLEAGAYGRAIITTDAPGGRDLVEDGKNGLLIPIKNYRILAQSMDRLINNSELRQCFAKEMYKKICNEYDSMYLSTKLIKTINNKNNESL